MLIRVYGKPGCQTCEAAKKKLELLGLDFEFRNIEELTEPHEGWRDDGSVEVMAAYSHFNHSLPVIFVDDVAYDYPGAMRELKARGARAKEADG